MAASKVSVVVKTIRSLTDRKLSHNIFTPVSEKGRHESRDFPRRRQSWESAQTFYGTFEIDRSTWNERKALLNAVFKEEKEPLSEKIGTNRPVALTKEIDFHIFMPTKSSGPEKSVHVTQREQLREAIGTNPAISPTGKAND